MASSSGNTGQYGSTVSFDAGRQPTPGSTTVTTLSSSHYSQGKTPKRGRMGDDGLWIHSVDEVSFSGSDISSKRRSKRWYHDVADFANLLKSFIGTNYLALAYGIKLAGLGLGIGGLIMVSLLTAHCCHLIVKVKYHAIRKVISKRRSPTNSPTNFVSSLPGLESPEEKAMFQKLQSTVSYADIGRTAYGPWGARFVLIFLVITQMGFCVNYHIFIGSNIYSLIKPVDTNSSVPSSSGLQVIEQVGLLQQSAAAVLANGSLEEAAPQLYSTSPAWIPPLSLLVLIPLPIFIAFTLFRNIRVMGFVSLIANGMMSAGYFVVIAYIISTFSLADDLKWFEWSTFPVFLGQAASSYEAIGTIISIEASMAGNHHRYPVCLYSVVSVFSSMLTLSAILGYLKYGAATEQILVQNLPQTGALIITVNAALIIAVLFTYPLQVYPVIEILEGALFAKGGLFGPKKRSPLDDMGTENTPLVEDEIGKVVPDSVATWKRNIFRVLIAVVIAGLAVVFRDRFAYVNAFVGAIGSCPLAFILPCLFHLKICGFRLKRAVIVKDIIIIVIGTLIGVISLAVVLYQIIGNVSF